MRTCGAAGPSLRQLSAGHRQSDVARQRGRENPASAATYSLQRFMMPPFFLALSVLLADSDRGSMSQDRW